MKTLLRSLLRRYSLTMNTIRYRVEWRCLAKAAAKFPPFETIADGGCGSGEMLRKMLAAGYAKSGIGIEPDDELFPLLKENLGGNPKVELIQSGLEKIPLPDERLDAFMSTQVLEHIEDHESVAREIYRVLKPGGILLLGVPHPPEPFPNVGHVREGYTEADLRALFEPLGFVALDFDYYLVDATIKRILFARDLPLRGAFLPIRWGDCEAHLNREERRHSKPFGILGVFKKPDQA